MKFFPPYQDEGEVVASWGQAQLIRYLDGKFELRVASWGQAQLIRYLDGKFELRGGSDQDWAKAKAWMSLFWREASISD